MLISPARNDPFAEGKIIHISVVAKYILQLYCIDCHTYINSYVLLYINSPQNIYT